MSKVMNRAEAPRGFNVIEADGTARQVVLMPGETSDDLDMSLSGDAVFVGMVRGGDLAVDDRTGPDAADQIEKGAKAAKAKLAKVAPPAAPAA